MPMSFLQVFALERAGERNFAFGPAADRADIALNGGAGTARSSFAANFAKDRIGHSLLAIIGAGEMKRVDLHIKVTIDLDEDEKPELVAREICRQLEKMYVVRSAELSSVVETESSR